MTLALCRAATHALLPSIAAAILSYQLFIPPRVGLANNGDFGLVAGVFALHAPIEDEYAFADLKYNFDRHYYWRSHHYSSEQLLAALGVGLNKLFTSTRVFDMRWMGLLHGLLFVVALFLLQPLLAETPPLSRVLLSSVVVLIFADYMYVSYFNTFYMDAASYIFLLLAVVFFLRAARWRRWRDAVLLILCSVAMVLSKSQHAVLGMWIAAVLALFGANLWPQNGRVLSISSAVIVCAAALVGLKIAPPIYVAQAYYSVVFYQVLPHSENMSRTLQELGLDASYGKWVGTHAFSIETGMNDSVFVKDFIERASYSRLALYFAKHPRDAYIVLSGLLARSRAAEADDG